MSIGLNAVFGYSAAVGRNFAPVAGFRREPWDEGF